MSILQETMTVSVFELGDIPDKIVLVAKDYTQQMTGIFLMARDTQEVLRRECVSLDIPDGVLVNTVELMFRGSLCPN